MNILNSKSIDKGNSPKDITIIRKIFSNLGIEEYEKNTLNYMSEFINSYIIDILQEAKKNMILSKREKINIEDVESAVNTKQNHMYKNRTTVQEMKKLADRVNLMDLPKIPESQIVLRPPVDNNLLKNNFQIYSEELNKALIENKNMIENTSLRVEDNFMLGNKRKVNFNIGNDSKNNLNSEHNGKQQKNKRKISLNQAFKKTSQENAKREGINLIENENNNIKINFAEPKKIVNIKSNNSINLNSINNNEDEDFDNDEVDNTNNIGESTLNKKEEEEDELGDDDVEGEELEGDDNEEINESNANEGIESLSKRDDKDKNDNQLDFIHGENNDEENFDEDS